jgi:CBS domain-containing protein
MRRRPAAPRKTVDHAMARISNAAPLIALDAVVLDTETTGIDPAHARVVEIAAVRLSGGKIAEETFHRLVRPDQPIPAAAVSIHGIDDAAVASAPAFSEVWPELSLFIGQAVVIGHTLGFDLAVLKRECERAGLQWVRPRGLDTRLLAEVAAPELAGFSLEQLAAWLGVAVDQRHSALGDASTTAKIFIAMLPKLRDGGIRTLAEAERTCLALSDVLTQQHRIGWVEPVEAPGRTELSAFRIDSHPYRHRIGDAMSVPKFAAPETTIGDALKRMTRERVSSLFVLTPQTAPVPHQTGIITERDVLRALASRGGEALSMPVAHVMSRPLASVPADELGYRAIGHMRRLNVRHLGVTDENGRVVGALSARDLLKMRAEKAVWLGDEIEQAEDVSALARAWSKLPLVAEVLRAEDLSGRDIAAVISGELAALTRRAAILAERRLHDSHGEAPCAYSFAVLGSAGRGESLLAMDQDNALVFADDATGQETDPWFERLGAMVADILHEVGVPYCKGGVMAKNPQWRGSLLTWRDRVADWILRSRPQDLLSVDIFFDLRGVHGDPGLAATLRQDAFALAAGEVGFAKLLAESAGSIEPGLGLFGRFRTDQGRIDLKRSGLFGIVTFARVLAIRHQLVEASTPARLDAIKALGLGAEADLDALTEAQGTFLDLLIDQQIEDVQHGLPASNKVLIKRFSRRDRERLRAALEAVRNLDTLTRDLLFRA